MSTKRIVCTERSSSGHGHIVKVGIGTDADQATDSESVATVRASLAAGQVYYTYGERSGKVALVRRWDCSCGVLTIRSHPDATTDNNLDNLRACSWRS
jgi:hypothetical protein